jgi:hypothetical protein
MRRFRRAAVEVDDALEMAEQTEDCRNGWSAVDSKVADQPKAETPTSHPPGEGVATPKCSPLVRPEGL